MSKETEKYHRWVAWSDDDQCYLGRCPDLFFGGVHGNEPLEVARELQQVIDEWAVDFRETGAEFPPVRIKPAMEVA